MKFILVTIGILLLNGCAPAKSFKITSETIIKKYKTAINTNNYNLIKDNLSTSFKVDRMDTYSSWVTFYSYINYNKNEKIGNIKIDSVKTLSDTTGILYLSQSFHAGVIPFEINLNKENLTWKISRISTFMPPGFVFITRCSYRPDDIFGNDPAKNILNLTIFDVSKARSITNDYTIYYDSEDLKSSADSTINFLKYLDGLLLNKYNFKDIHREAFLLSKVNSTNNITIGEGLDIPWVLSLPNNKLDLNQVIKEKIATTYSHEITEGTLVHVYNLQDIKFRWFRDGLSDYIAYKYSLLYDPSSAASYFLENRVNDYKKNRQNGNLLDWRGGSSNKDADIGKLYGSEYNYENERGQYGRAFMFFRDNFENDESHLINILSTIYKVKQNISVEKLLEIMSKELNKDVVKILSGY